VLTIQPLLAPGAVAPPDRPALFAAVAEQVARLPDVRSTALSQVIPFRGSIVLQLRAEGVDSIPRLASGGPYAYPVSGGFLETMGIDVVRGRSIQSDDRKGAPQVAVVNETMARTVWGGGDPLGRCLFIGSAESLPCTRVVGVVEDARRSSIREDAQQLYYVPFEQELTASGPASPRPQPSVIVVGTRSEADAAIARVRAAALAVDDRIRFADVQPLQALVDPELRPWRMGATMFSVFGLLALLVAGVGLYSLLANDVERRTREIGVRIALGASRGAILTTFVGRALALAAGGVVLGALAALPFGSRLGGLLFETSPRDPVTLAGVAATLAVIALLAGSLPAWRATKVDPNVALRSE
jgi:hypothetical protein